jgi:serine/threonine protein phosphatase PrpC
MSVRLVVSARTDVGRVRDHNEDGYLVDTDLGLVAVADGMGGHRGGEVASATALDTLREAFTDSGDLSAAVVAANDAVFERSSADDAVRGMGTTMTAAALEGERTLLVGHVGDSRAYLWRDAALTRLTTDHSLVEELIAAGELTEEQAERDPRRSMITRALGLELGVAVDVVTVELQGGDRLLFCSDGLTTMIREAQTQAILAEAPEPGDAAHRLVEAANAAGGADNTTVLVVDVVEEDDDPPDADRDQEARAPDTDPGPGLEAPPGDPEVIDATDTTDTTDAIPDPEPPRRGRRRWWRFGR